jgi:ribosomal-protein-alanine N-acetyltransferase
MKLEDIVTARLEMRLLGIAELEHLLAGRAEHALPGVIGCEAFLSEHRFLEMRLGDLRADPAYAPWSLRALIERRTGQVVGHAGFHGRPEAGTVELGYTVFESFRGQGFAQEAVRASMRWAVGAHRVSRFVLSISPTNAASIALATKLGFARVGQRIDDVDGVEDVYVRLGAPVD